MSRGTEPVRAATVDGGHFDASRSRQVVWVIHSLERGRVVSTTMHPSKPQAVAALAVEAVHSADDGFQVEADLEFGTLAVWEAGDRPHGLLYRLDLMSSAQIRRARPRVRVPELAVDRPRLP